MCPSPPQILHRCSLFFRLVADAPVGRDDLLEVGALVKASKSGCGIAAARVGQLVDGQRVSMAFVVEDDRSALDEFTTRKPMSPSKVGTISFSSMHQPEPLPRFRLAPAPLVWMNPARACRSQVKIRTRLCNVADVRDSSRKRALLTPRFCVELLGVLRCGCFRRPLSVEPPP